MKRLPLLLGLALVAGSLSGCAVSSPVQVFDCVKYVEKPREFTPYCADSGQVFTKIKWSQWGQDSAVGTAVARTNTCEPTCAAGKVLSTPVEIRLGKPAKVANKSAFSSVTVVYLKHLVGHPKRETLDLIIQPMGE